jgi:hypothetical protein
MPGARGDAPPGRDVNAVPGFRRGLPIDGGETTTGGITHGGKPGAEATGQASPTVPGNRQAYPTSFCRAAMAAS